MTEINAASDPEVEVVTELLSALEDLRRENERLSDERDAWKGRHANASGDRAAFLKENQKLREQRDAYRSGGEELGLLVVEIRKAFGDDATDRLGDLPIAVKALRTPRLMSPESVESAIRSRGIVADIGVRWGNGTDHDPRSMELVDAMSVIDSRFNDLAFDIRTGGDGDNGEYFAYLFDVFFDAKDASK